MLRRKGFGVGRELKHLTTTGGKAGRLCDDKSKWTFDCIPGRYQNRSATPAVCTASSTNERGITASVPLLLNDDANEEDDDMLLASSDDAFNQNSDTDFDDDSDDADSNEDTDSDSDDDLDANSLEVDDVPQHNKLVSGNRIINHPSLVSTLQAIGSCQHCVQNVAEYFLLFCDGKFEEKFVEVERKRKKMEYLHESMNVREWYKEWEKQEEESRSRCTLTVQETTYGLATNSTIKCNRCKQVLATVKAAKIKQSDGGPEESKKTKRACKCGSHLHSRTTHRLCPLNSQRQQAAPIATITPLLPVPFTNIPTILRPTPQSAALQGPPLPTPQPAAMI
jgi:hypothetical protein